MTLATFGNNKNVSLKKKGFKKSGQPYKNHYCYGKCNFLIIRNLKQFQVEQMHSFYTEPVDITKSVKVQSKIKDGAASLLISSEFMKQKK